MTNQVGLKSQKENALNKISYLSAINNKKARTD
jgi:hypothetical protein